jgi:hypothetical protein
MLIKVKTPKKNHPKDVNSLTRAKGDRVRDGFDKAKFAENYDLINWRSNCGV